MSSSCTVVFRGKKFEITFEEKGDSPNVGDLRQRLDEAGLSGAHDVRLISKGTVLSSNDILLEFPHHKKLMAMPGPSREAIVSVNKVSIMQRNRDKNLPVLSSSKDRDSNLGGGGIESKPRRRFLEVVALKGMPLEKESQRMLEILADDPGIVEIMTKRGWTVGRLTELPPIETESSKLLGLNKNKGAEILLRLTFEDGLRSYSSVIDTLLHELVHNEISPHNRAFHEMHRDLCREYKDITKYKKSGEEVMKERKESEAKRRRMFQGRTAALGSSSDTNNNHLINNIQLTPAQMAARAAEMRLSEHEREMVQGCGTTEKDDP